MEERQQRRQTRLSWWREELELLGQYLAPRRSFALALMLIASVGLMVLAYQFPPQSYYVEVGGVGDTPNIRNFHVPRYDETTNLTYRWTDSYSYVDIPGIGGNLPYTLSLRLDPTQIDGTTANLTLLLAGTPLFEGKLQPGWQTLTYSVDQSAAIAPRDFVLELRSSTFTDPEVRSRNLGVKLDWLRVEPRQSGFVVPTLGVLLRLALFIALIYLLVNRFVGLLLGIGRFDEFIALVITGVAAAVVVLLMLFAHGGMVLAAGHLLIAAAVGYGVLVGSRLLLAWVQEREPVGERTTVTRSATMLAAGVTIAFLVKFGGMGLPQTIVKDMDWHLRFVRVLKAGGLEQLLAPGVLSVTPGEWGLGADALIPKSPLYYIAMWPLAYLPGSLETWLKLVICLIDVSGALILYFVASRSGLGRRAGLFAAAVYLLTPLSYRVLSFGTLPTIFAQWLTLIAFSYLILHLHKLHRPRHFLIAAALLTLVLLAFPTMVIFTPVVLGVAAVAGAIGSREPTLRRNYAIVLPLCALTAAGLALLIYYGAYLEGIINTTLPAMLQGTAISGVPIGERKGGWLGLLLDNIAFYGSWLPIIFAVSGLALLIGKRGKGKEEVGEVGDQSLNAKAQNLKYILLGWLLILPLFYVVNYRIDLIGKHLLYTMYPLALASGVTMAALWLHGKGARRLVLTMLVVLGSSAVGLWLDRLLNGGR